MIPRALLIGFLAAASLSAFAAQTVPADSLFARLGGTERVNAIVDATVVELANTNAPAFAGRDAHTLKNQLMQRICAVTGGGCRPPGADGSDADAGLVEALRVAMRTHGVPLAARNELIEALSTRQSGATLALNPRP